MKLSEQEAEIIQTLRRVETAAHVIIVRSGKIVRFKTEIDHAIVKKAMDDGTVPRGTNSQVRTQE